MSEIFLTSDTHFCHNQAFVYEPRGFSSVNEMNEAIIDNWNSIVKPEDRVIHLGDIMLNNNEIGIECLKRLNGQICIVWGNHDSDARKTLICALPNVITLGYAHQFRYGKFSIYVSHYPTLTANYSNGKHFNQNVINLHAHTHQTTNFLNPTNPFMYHVGVDSHNCTPVHIDEVMFDIRQRWEEISHLPTPIIPEDNYPYDKIFT